MEIQTKFNDGDDVLFEDVDEFGGRLLTGIVDLITIRIEYGIVEIDYNIKVNDENYFLNEDKCFEDEAEFFKSK